ncbi:MAG: lamin tail domain-containing protein [Phycisphaerales bacterium]|nr:hypothetical protein [Planctomycetota bacterium]MCH8509356.1 lamin tail domain-containing protein [Phycisphaerales bacterium]
MNITIARPAILLAVAAAAASASDHRVVQFASIDLDAAVIELRNYGSDPVDLTGWQFCTSNPFSLLLYTTGGLDGRVLAPGESLFFHAENDAPVDPDRINVSTLGGQFALFVPFAYGLGIYAPPAGSGFIDFGDGTLMADYIQFSLDGVPNAVAGFRGPTAVAGGIWSDENDWVALESDSARIELITPGSLPRSPSDYRVLGDCPADLDGNGELNFFDLAIYLDLFNAGDPAADLAPPFGVLNFFDLAAYLDLFNAGCP